jgi:hypothetical protein
MVLSRNARTKYEHSPTIFSENQKSRVSGGHRSFGLLTNDCVCRQIVALLAGSATAFPRPHKSTIFFPFHGARHSSALNIHIDGDRQLSSNSRSEDHQMDILSWREPKAAFPMRGYRLKLSPWRGLEPKSLQRSADHTRSMMAAPVSRDSSGSDDPPSAKIQPLCSHENLRLCASCLSDRSAHDGRSSVDPVGRHGSKLPLNLMTGPLGPQEGYADDYSHCEWDRAPLRRRS